MSKILITGATGFVGACLTEDLVREGHEVAVILRAFSNKWRLKKALPRIRVIEADLCDATRLGKVIQELNPEVIFHLAAYGGYPFQQDTAQIINTNIIGTVNLVSACSQIDYKRLVNVSSSSEYGAKLEPMRETDLLEPINTYGVAKSAATLYCQMIARTEKKPIVTVRLFSPFGYYEDKSRLVPSVVLACLRGANPKLASGDPVRDFIFIEDVISLLKRVSQADNVNGKIYNGGFGSQHSVAEMVDLIIRKSGAKVRPKWGSLPGRKNDSPKWEADLSAVKNELKWAPQVSLEAGVEKTIAWFQNNLELYPE
ncbi:MAG: NAD-dependent epimerase/dehydratase family protein [Firmicutes bacterium]|nr:NAD-dependent epimerase/dehydratase family protein [Bacillota bacterium]